MKMVSSRFHDKELDDISMKAAKRSIGETPETKTEGLKTLKIKLLSIEDLKPRLDDNFLLRFLRVAKFDVSKAFERVRKHYQIQKRYPHIFDMCYPSAGKNAQVVRHFHASPIRCEDHSAIIILKRGLFDPSRMTFEEIFLLDLLVLDHVVENSLTQICGVTAILDFSGYGYQHFFQDSPRRIRMAVDSFQNAFPMRFKSIHVINAPQIFTFLYNLCYHFMTRKLRNRLHVHGSNESLLSSLPPEMLPKEYGGKIPESDLVDLVEEVIHKEDYYKDQLQYGYRKKM